MKNLAIAILIGFNLAAFGASAKSDGYRRAVAYFQEDKRLYPRPSRPIGKQSKAAKKKRPAAKKKTVVKNSKNQTARKPASLAQAKKPVSKKLVRKPRKLVVSF